MKIQKRQDTEFFGTKSGNTNAIAVGYATETTNYGEIATGILNKSTRGKHSNTPEGVIGDSEATLFSVGCGTSKGRKNALEVKGDGSVIISNGDNNMNVADKIKEALAIENSIELVKSTDNDLQYTLMVNDTAKGEINIPKDQFLKNVVYDDTEKQLVFTFVTLDEDEHIEKVPVGDLKDIYTAGDNITIENNKISADLSTAMTAISNEKIQRETTDNEIKSTLDTKADVSAIPTKTSQLANDSGYLTEHQSLDGYAKKSDIPDMTTKADLVDGKIKPEQLSDNIPVYTGDSSDKSIYFSIYDGSNVSHSCDLSTSGIKFKIGRTTWFQVFNYDNDEIYLLFGKVKIKPDDLSKLTTQLDNITSATTADEVVTKFNALLTDLKAKRYMTPDATE